MRSSALALLLIGTVPAAAPAAAQDACVRAAAPCTVELGTYRVALPEGDGPHPALMFLHGFGGSGNGMLGLSGVVRTFTDRGYAVVAPDGLPVQTGGTRGSWSFLPDAVRPRRRDEAAFFAQVMDDAAARHGIDPHRAMLSGFSAGGFMVNYLACEVPDAFAAYAPVSGGFWRPHPDRCAGPVKLLHTHGYRDSTVPLEGRPLRNGEYVQGDVFEGLGIWRTANGCAWDDPDGYSTTGQFHRRRWDCDAGAALEFALFDGGHGVPEGWADMAIDWFETVVPRAE